MLHHKSRAELSGLLCCNGSSWPHTQTAIITMELVLNRSTSPCCLLHWRNVSSELRVSYLKTNTYDFLLLDMIWKVLCNDVSIRQQDIADSLEEAKQDNGLSKQFQTQIYQMCASASAGGSHLGKSFHVVADDLRVGTFQFADDFKALIELREYVHHGTGEQGVLWGDLELQSEKTEQDQRDQAWGRCAVVIEHQEWGAWLPVRAQYAVLLCITDNVTDPPPLLHVTAIKSFATSSLWKRLDENHWGDHREMMGSKALINSMPISE